MRLKLPLFALLVLIHLISNLPMEQPMVLADELGYLGNARYLAGTAPMPDLQEARFYHFGYSLLLVPTFWLFSDPLLAYKAALTLNAFLMSSLFLVLCSLLGFLGGVSQRASIWIAFTCSLYPPLVVYSDFAWAESAFIPAYALAVLLLGRYLQSRTTLDVVLFGLLVGLLYTIHPRALPVLAVAGGYLLLLAALGIVAKSQALLGGGAASLVLGLTRIGNQQLEGLGWGGTGEFSATQLASRMLPGGPWVSLILRAAGQLFYVALSTHGLFLLGLVATTLLIRRHFTAGNRRRALADPQVGALIFLVTGGFGILLGSTALKVYSLFGRDTFRAANFIFGRYNEAFAVLLMALGLAWLYKTRLDKLQRIRQALAVGTGLLVLSGLVLAQVRIATAATEQSRPWLVEATNIVGVYPFVDLFGMPRLYLAALVSFAIFLVLSTLTRRNLGGSLALLALLFGTGVLYCERVNLQPARKTTADRLSFIPEVERLGPPEALDYDFAFRSYTVFYGAQYRLPKTVFRPFHSRQGEAPTTEVVISGRGWSQARPLDARLVVSAAAGDTAVWVLQGEIREGLPSPSFVGVNIGIEPGLGIEERGFYPPEEVAGAMVRWTDGAATLRVPWNAGEPPRLLVLEATTPEPSGTRLQVIANDVELWNDWIPEVWSKSMSLAEVPTGDLLTLELNSDTLNPLQDIPGASDNRELGVQVNAIRILTESRASGLSFLDRPLGHEPVLGVDESGFYAPEKLDEQPVRWTNGAATLEVPLDPQRLPRWLEIEVASPGRDGARLQVLANGLEIWRGRVPETGLSKALDLEAVPITGSLLIELRSDTFVPAQTVAGSSDSRTLGVLVKKVRLTRTGD